MASKLLLCRALARRGAAVSHHVVPVVSYFSTQVIPGVGMGKTSTGLVGLKVDHEAIPHMISKYQALLDRMADSDMPEDAFYRTTMEKVIRYRLKAAMDHPDDPEMVEELCNCGQVEELVEQADDEMEVLEMYLKGRYWERVKDVDIDVLHDIEYNPDPAKDEEE